MLARLRSSIFAILFAGLALPASAAVRFLALGDAGEGNRAQYANGKAMAALCARKGCDFVIYLGDNFYGQGITRPDDPQFQQKFELPYAGLDLPFYALLGNHDYGDPPLDYWKPQFQLAYTWRSARWKMPHPFYHVQKGEVALFALDTTGYLQGINTDAQRAWLAGALAISGAKWKIVAGHHPYLSNGEHGNAGNYEGCGNFCPDIVNGAPLKRLFEDVVCGNADIVLTAHDHNLQWPKARCGIEFIVSGAGSKTTGLVGRDGNPTHFEYDRTPGFLWASIDGERFSAEFYDLHGKLLYQRSITKAAPPAWRCVRPWPGYAGCLPAQLRPSGDGGGAAAIQGPAASTDNRPASIP
ncbi:MAG TPA: metallophosphoesterase [Telluria sp.]|jgi:hypothetical protein